MFTDIQQSALQYQIPISAQQIGNMVKQSLQGATVESMYVAADAAEAAATKQFQEQAQGSVPGAQSDQIAAGQTVQNLVAPYFNVAESITGVPASTMMADQQGGGLSKWSAFLQGGNNPSTKTAQAPGTSDDRPAAQAGPQMMTLDQWKTYLMQNPTYGFDKTQGAKDMAEQMTSAILNEFGKVNTNGSSSQPFNAYNGASDLSAERLAVMATPSVPMQPISPPKDFATAVLNDRRRACDAQQHQDHAPLDRGREPHGRRRATTRSTTVWEARAAVQASVRITSLEVAAAVRRAGNGCDSEGLQAIPGYQGGADGRSKSSECTGSAVQAGHHQLDRGRKATTRGRDYGAGYGVEPIGVGSAGPAVTPGLAANTPARHGPGGRSRRTHGQAAYLQAAQAQIASCGREQAATQSSTAANTHATRTRRPRPPRWPRVPLPSAASPTRSSQQQTNACRPSKPTSRPTASPQRQVSRS